MSIVKTGECKFRKEDGSLWRPDSFLNEETGEAFSEEVFLEPPPPTEEDPPSEEQPVG